MVSRRTVLKLSLYGSMLAVPPLLTRCSKTGTPLPASSSRNLASSDSRVAEYLAQVTARPRRPNVLLMVLDDAGWGDLPAYGNRTAVTPNIDRLAREGVKFETFHSGSPVCAPSRTCLFTGRHPAKVGINSNPNTNNWKDKLNKVEFLPKDTSCLTSVFKSAGYQTAFIGKAHFGAGKNAPSMLERGVDRFFGWSCSIDDAAEYRKWVKFVGKEQLTCPRISVPR